MRKVFVLNGVNLGTLGTRRPEIYGTMTLDDIERLIKEEFPALDLEFRQTDFEGEMVGFIREAADSDGLVINAGAWTHYSYALHDALEALDVPKVEVHLSNVSAREEWRRVSVISPAVDAVIAGMGVHGYVAAVRYVLEGGADQGPPRSYEKLAFGAIIPAHNQADRQRNCAIIGGVCAGFSPRGSAEKIRRRERELPTMISTNQFRNGRAIRVDGKRFTILFFQHVKPGKGGAFVRTRLRNIDSGAVVEKTFGAGEKLENVRTESRPMTYLYRDGDLLTLWTRRPTIRRRCTWTS